MDESLFRDGDRVGGGQESIDYECAAFVSNAAKLSRGGFIRRDRLRIWDRTSRRVERIARNRSGNGLGVGDRETEKQEQG